MTSTAYFTSDCSGDPISGASYTGYSWPDSCRPGSNEASGFATTRVECVDGMTTMLLYPPADCSADSLMVLPLPNLNTCAQYGEIYSIVTLSDYSGACRTFTSTSLLKHLMFGLASDTTEIPKGNFKKSYL